MAQIVPVVWPQSPSGPDESRLDSPSSVLSLRVIEAVGNTDVLELTPSFTFCPAIVVINPEYYHARFAHNGLPYKRLEEDLF